MITKLKQFENLLSEKTVEQYLSEINNSEYSEISFKLFKMVREEGWIDELEDYYNEHISITTLKYTTLNLTEKDKNGLIDMNDDILNKFNQFDIKLKTNQTYPLNTIDFIDYDKGIVYIVKYER